MGSDVVAVIPARYESTRFPGKPLALIGDKPMIEHVYRRARAVPMVARTMVATDDPRIEQAVRAFGGEVAMTRPGHPSGTDRVAEVAASLHADIIVNIQGDLPFLEGQMLQQAVEAMRSDPNLPMATLKVPIRDAAELVNPNVVKVVTDREGYALFFSRSPLPCWRDGLPSTGLGYRHIGLYAFRREFLLTFAGLTPTPLEQAEKLEQLRALEWGFRIRVVETADRVGVEVDTPADLERARALLAGKEERC
jgi:3-deoxy-manno-octulosonate cytidylyltransferase (CMP-KDO synthetase)